jgi:hypothetical protein
MKEGFVAFIAFMVFGYLLSAFCAWDLNPGNWDAFGRTLSIIFSAFFGVMFAAAIQEYYNGKHN